MVGCGNFFVELFQNDHFYVLIMYNLWSPLRHVKIKFWKNFTFKSFLLTLVVQLIQKYLWKYISETFIFDYPLIRVLPFQRIALACVTW